MIIRVNKHLMRYRLLVFLMIIVTAFCIAGHIYRPVPKEPRQLVSRHRVFATKVMKAAQACDLETIRNFADRELLSTVVQIENFQQHCVTGALSYEYDSEVTKSGHTKQKNGAAESYSLGFIEYTAHLDGKTFPMTVITERKAGNPTRLHSMTDPYYEYIKDKDIFAKGSAP